MKIKNEEQLLAGVNMLVELVRRDFPQIATTAVNMIKGAIEEEPKEEPKQEPKQEIKPDAQ